MASVNGIMHHCMSNLLLAMNFHPCEWLLPGSRNEWERAAFGRQGACAFRACFRKSSRFDSRGTLTVAGRNAAGHDSLYSFRRAQ